MSTTPIFGIVNAEGSNVNNLILGHPPVPGIMDNVHNHSNVIVLDTTHRQNADAEPNLKEDLWLSTADGRYESTPIPVIVGPYGQARTFYVHKDVLIKSKWFRAALCGDFSEAMVESVDLPEEEPAIFHFVLAFLYEGRFTPLRSAFSALEEPRDKGKRRENEAEPAAEDSDSSTSSNTTSSSARSRQEQDRRRRDRERVRQQTARRREKHPDQHRRDCRCPRCAAGNNLHCWSCGARQVDNGVPIPPRRRQYFSNPAPPGHPNGTPRRRNLDVHEGRIKGEDLRTWLMTYELHLNVYICANRYLMDDLKDAVIKSTIDMLETAGTDAAQPEVLQLCATLHQGVPETDKLLKMVLCRVGFLQPVLWKVSPAETNEFLVSHPEIAAVMLRETVMKHQVDTDKKGLPPMEIDPTSETQPVEEWRPRRR